jgi:hypothetical protein
MMNAKYIPSPADVGQLMALLQMPGYRVLTKIFESEIDQMQVDMMNADPTNEKEVLVRHNLALAAGMFYQRVVNRIHLEKEQFGAKSSANDIIPDATEELLQY